MTRAVDNLIALRVLSMLVTPFTDTDAYRLGVIDKDGNTLIKPSKLQGDQKDAYTYLNRLVFSLKKLLNRLPGGDTKIKNLIAALWLVKESYENKKPVPMLEDLSKLVQLLDKVTLVEEEIQVHQFLESRLKEDGGAAGASGGSAGLGAGAPTSLANVSGIGVSTDKPVARKKDITKYKKNNAGLIAMTRRARPVQ